MMLESRNLPFKPFGFCLTLFSFILPYCTPGEPLDWIYLLFIKTSAYPLSFLKVVMVF